MTLLPAGPFKLILMDPPWAFRTYNGDKVPQRAERQHYSTMTIDRLRQMPVADVADRDAALVMWVVGSHFEQAFDLGRALGFEFKTDLLVWRKPRIGMGYWTRKETEQAWLFTRGKPKRLDAGVRQVIDAPVREHSRKPDEQYERLERLFGDVPRLEMFARRQWPGWQCWGDQAPAETVSARLTRLSEAFG